MKKKIDYSSDNLIRHVKCKSYFNDIYSLSINALWIFFSRFIVISSLKFFY